MAALQAKKKQDEEEEMGVIDKLFCKDVNLSFGEDLQLAARAAVFIIICAMPFLAPREYCPICYEAVRTKFYNSASVVYFVFTLYKTTGDTIYFACGGLTGTVIAVLNIWLMMGFFPGGYQPGTENADFVFWAGNVWGATFVFCMLYLNWDGNTRVFSLTTYVWYWMAFLNYNTPTGFAHNFKVKLNGRAMSEMAVATSGCVIAIIASFIPWPLLATKKMDNTGKYLIRKLHTVWGEFVEYYTGDDKNPYTQNILGKELAGLQSAAGTLSPFITSSWYECLGLGKWQEKRMMFKVVDRYLSECFNRLSCVLSGCLAEDFDDTHDDLMKAVRDDMSEVIDKIGDLLSHCEDNIMNCGFNRSGREKAATMIQNLENAVDTLTKKFLKTTKEKGLYKVTDQVSGEFLVASNLCCWARITCEFCNELMDEMPEETGSWRDGVGLMGAFAPNINNTPDNLNYTMRGWISVMVAFYIGYNGVAGKMIANYNAALASTICVLMTKSLGGALANNLKRLQGVVLGTVIGQVAYALLAWCVWWGYLSVGAFVFVWSFVALYMYYHSDNYSTVGLLLAVFANGSMLQGCSDEVFDPTVAYNGIINTVSGITIMAVFDMLLSGDRASNKAMKAYSDASQPLVTMADELLDSKVKTIAPRKGAIRGLIANANRWNNEASLEPRYWRGDWPTSTYAAGTHALTCLRFNLSTIDYALVESGGSDRPKAPHFLKASVMGEFEELRVMVAEQMHFIEDQMAKRLLKEVIVDVFDDDNAPDTELQSTEKEEQMREKLQAWAVAVSINKEVMKPEEDTKSSFDSLEDDPVADMCILYGCMINIISELEAAHEAIAGA
jgi:hypothetical protein